jgi:bile acid:Na+ symporter, BASS family
MSTAAVIVAVVKASIALLVFGLGLHGTLQDATYLLRRPNLLARALLSMSVVMPLTAFLIAIIFRLHHAVKVALITLAMSPVPPFLPSRAMKAGGPSAYTIGLLTATSLLSIAIVPITVWVFGVLFRVPFTVSWDEIARVVTGSVLIPLLIGMGVRHFVPVAAERAARLVMLLAMGVLVAGTIPILFSAWPAIETLLGNGTILAIVAMTFIGLGVGHFLGGPNRDHRTALALSSAARHPGVALAIASANFPGDKVVPAAILLSLVITTLVSVPYVKRSTQIHAASLAHAHDAEHEAATHVGRGPNRRG